MHLDLKPGNMMYVKVPDAKKEVLKVIDFGSSKLLEKNRWEKNKVANSCRLIQEQYTTLNYRAPENNIACNAESEESQEYFEKEVQVFLCGIFF